MFSSMLKRAVNEYNLSQTSPQEDLSSPLSQSSPNSPGQRADVQCSDKADGVKSVPAAPAAKDTETVSVENGNKRKRKPRRIYSPDDDDEDQSRRKQKKPKRLTSFSSTNPNRPYDVMPNGDPFCCDLCKSRYVVDRSSKKSLKNRRSKHTPYPKQMIDPVTQKLMTLCNGCSHLLSRTSKKNDRSMAGGKSKATIEEEKQKYLQEAKNWAQQLATKYDLPNAIHLYCPVYQKSMCGCLQMYIDAEGNETEMQKRASRLSAMAAEARRLSVLKCYDTDGSSPEKNQEPKTGGDNSSPQKNQEPETGGDNSSPQKNQDTRDTGTGGRCTVGNIGLGNGHKKSEKFSKFVLSNRDYLKRELDLCERATQKILSYSNNFIHKRLKTEKKRYRATPVKGKARLGLLLSFDELPKRRCCVDNCVMMALTHRSLLEEWRSRSQKGQTEARKVIAEMLTPSANARKNCYTFVSAVTGCSRTTAVHVNHQMIRTGGSREPPEHGLKKYHNKKTGTTSSSSKTDTVNNSSDVIKPGETLKDFQQQLAMQQEQLQQQQQLQQQLLQQIISSQTDKSNQSENISVLQQMTNQLNVQIQNTQRQMQQTLTNIGLLVGHAANSNQANKTSNDDGNQNNSQNRGITQKDNKKANELHALDKGHQKAKDAKNNTNFKNTGKQAKKSTTVSESGQIQTEVQNFLTGLENSNRTSVPMTQPKQVLQVVGSQAVNFAASQPIGAQATNFLISQPVSGNQFIVSPSNIYSDSASRDIIQIAPQVYQPYHIVPQQIYQQHTVQTLQTTQQLLSSQGQLTNPMFLPNYQVVTSLANQNAIAVQNVSMLQMPSQNISGYNLSDTRPQTSSQDNKVAEVLSNITIVPYLVESNVPETGELKNSNELPIEQQNLEKPLIQSADRGQNSTQIPNELNTGPVYTAVHVEEDKNVPRTTTSKKPSLKTGQNKHAKGLATKSGALQASVPTLTSEHMNFSLPLSDVITMYSNNTIKNSSGINNSPHELQLSLQINPVSRSEGEEIQGNTLDLGSMFIIEDEAQTKQNTPKGDHCYNVPVTSRTRQESNSEQLVIDEDTMSIKSHDDNVTDTDEEVQDILKTGNKKLHMKQLKKSGTLPFLPMEKGDTFILPSEKQSSKLKSLQEMERSDTLKLPEEKEPSMHMPLPARRHRGKRKIKDKPVTRSTTSSLKNQQVPGQSKDQETSPSKLIIGGNMPSVDKAWLRKIVDKKVD